MKTKKRAISLLTGFVLAAAMMLPVAASAQSQVFLGVNLGGLFAPPPVEVYREPTYYQPPPVYYSRPTYQPPPVYYSRPTYYQPRVVYDDPQVIYYQRGDRDWDEHQRGDWRRGGDQRDDHERHSHWHHDDDDDQ